MNKEHQRLDKLKETHKMLDKQIEELYNKFNDDNTVITLKKRKLWIKDEIRKIEEALKN